jgi:hypothetical protein
MLLYGCRICAAGLSPGGSWRSFEMAVATELFIVLLPYWTEVDSSIPSSSDLGRTRIQADSSARDLPGRMGMTSGAAAPSRTCGECRHRQSFPGTIFLLSHSKNTEMPHPFREKRKGTRWLPEALSRRIYQDDCIHWRPGGRTRELEEGGTGDDGNGVWMAITMT